MVSPTFLSKLPISTHTSLGRASHGLAMVELSVFDPFVTSFGTVEAFFDWIPLIFGGVSSGVTLLCGLL